MLTFCLDAKEIIPFNLVQLGFAHSCGPGIFWSAKYSVLLSLLKDHQLESFHHDLVNDLHDLPYGPFCAISHLVGLSLEQWLARAGEMVEHPLLKRTADSDNNGESSKKLQINV